MKIKFKLEKDTWEGKYGHRGVYYGMYCLSIIINEEDRIVYVWEKRPSKEALFKVKGAINKSISIYLREAAIYLDSKIEFTTI